MSVPFLLSDSETKAEHLARGVVRHFSAHGLVRVALDDEPDDLVDCLMLQTCACMSLKLDVDDAVLVWTVPGDDRSGVILGRIGPATAPVVTSNDKLEELVLEASQSLTLRCGEASITLRGDGKILIKGKDLVSRAERTNRIKGGSVAIN